MLVTDTFLRKTIDFDNTNKTPGTLLEKNKEVLKLKTCKAHKSCNKIIVHVSNVNKNNI